MAAKKSMRWAGRQGEEEEWVKEVEEAVEVVEVGWEEEEGEEKGSG